MDETDTTAAEMPQKEGMTMEDRYVLQITKAGTTGAEAVCVRLEIDGDRIKPVIAAASDLPVPRVRKAKVSISTTTPPKVAK